MKKTFLTLVAFLALSLTLTAQAPQSFQYQAVVRDAAGDIIANQTVGMRISLRQGSATGTIVYQETHSPMSNGFGLVNLAIGDGKSVSGNFPTIDWGNGPYFIEVEFDPAGGTSYSVMGTSQLLSVPYALYAENTDCCITGGFYRGDTLKLTRADGTVLEVLPCGITDLVTGALATVSCIENTAADNADLVHVAIDYTGMDENAVIINNGGGTVSGDDPSITPSGTIILSGLKEGDDWDVVILGGLSGSCNLLSKGTVASDICVPCGITAIETGTEPDIICTTNTPGDNNDNVTVEIDYVGVDPDAMVVNNGGGNIGGDDPATIPDGTIQITGLQEGDSWNITITGGASGACSLNSSGTISPASVCDPCGITGLETGTQAEIICVTNTLGINDMITVEIGYTGLDPNAIITNNGSGTIGGDDPQTTPNGTITLTGLVEGDSWDLSITGGINNNCSFNSSGSVPVDFCDAPQAFLDNGKTPCDLLEIGFDKNDLYGLAYEGGLIFFINNNDPGNCSGLVAAPDDQASAAWGCNFIFSGAGGTAVGAGATNTAAILANCSENDIAARKASQYMGAGYTDWFLPSRGELNSMYNNLKLLGLGNFNNAPYWSSTSSQIVNPKTGPIPTAVALRFSGGDILLTVPRSASYHVRAARAFSN